MGKKVAVVGATGAVGEAMRQVLQQRQFPIDEIHFFASERSAGRMIDFAGRQFQVKKLEAAAFDGLDIALFSIPQSISRAISPEVAKQGCVVIDNSNAFRMDPEVPLVVPEVNAHALKRHKGIIANPNCSTIQMVVVLKPLHQASRIKRVVVTTFQAVSGIGLAAIEELRRETRLALAGKEIVPEIFPHPIAFNVLPQIPQRAAFEDNLYTTEEMKMVRETQKIMEDDTIRVTATCVRVPVFWGHSEAVNIETEKKLTAQEAREILARSPGIEVVDDPAQQLYPLATDAAHRDETFVGRIREDESIENGLNLWIVSDNLLKGAALNAVQIAECLL